MAMKNKYAYRSRISEAKIRQFVKLFAVDLTASQIAELSGVNRNTVNRHVTAFRERIARYCEAESPVKVKSKSMKVTSAHDVFAESEDVAHEERPLFSACSNATVKSMRKSSLIAPGRLSRELSGDELALKVSFTRMGGEGMTDLSIWGIRSSFEYGILTANLPTNTRISMG